MAHEIMGNKEYGYRAAFIGEQQARNVWHTLGHYTGVDKKGNPVPFKSIDEAAKLGRILFDVRKVPVMIATPKGRMIEVPNQYLIVRDRFEDDERPADMANASLNRLRDELGPVILSDYSVTNRYNIYQTILAVDALRPLVESGLLNVTACGVLREGRKIWISAEITDAVVRTNPDGSPDTIKRHVLFTVGHDGKTANAMNVSDTRVVCANTERMATERGVNFWLKHNNKGGELAYRKAQESLSKISKDFKAVMDQFKFLASVKVKKAEVDVFFNALFPIPEGKLTFSAKRKKAVEKSTELFMGGTGNGGGTWWDLFNGVTEHIDWHSSSNVNSADHLDSIWFGHHARTRESALQIATDMASKKAPKRAMAVV